MNLLLDTHALIWFQTDDSRLSESLMADIENEGNRIHVSIASLWEISVKYSLNKLQLKKNLPDFIFEIESSAIEILPITTKHLLQLTSLHYHHRDPFDRLIIAQALIENYAVVTQDKVFSAYDVNVIWR
jgi:PIN domain nuclease of toxin-antitoxin system